MLDMTAFEHALKGADLVITGEGALDEQTLHGKLIEGICRHAAGHRVPVAALCGRLSASADELKRVGVAGAWSINDEELPLAQMLATTTANLERAAAKLPLESLIHAG
jgi:glycerate kinase